MILDQLENCHFYSPLHKRLKQAFAFLSHPDLKDLPPGTYEVDEEQIFAIVVKETGREKATGILETHQKYIDIQFVLAGADEMGWKAKNLCINPAGDYDPKIDAQFFNDNPDTWITTKPGSYAIFFPEDAHMAMFSSGIIHKAIIKVAVD